MAEIKKNQKKQCTVISQELLERIVSSVNGIKHGTVTLVIQDSKVIQIDRTEKSRL